MPTYTPPAYFLEPAAGPAILPPLGGPFPKTVERLAFEALGAILRGDPVLAGNGVKVWPDPAATAEENRQKLPDPNLGAEPNYGDLPMVRIWPTTCVSKRDTQVRDYIQWDVEVRCYAKGFDPLDAIDLWGAVRDAIWPTDPAARAAVAAALSIVTPKGALLSGRLSRQHDNPSRMGQDKYGQHVAGHLILAFNILS
jgi:hypothetical protein